MRTVLEVLRDKKLYAKASKCELFRDEVEFLGFIVGKGGVRIDPKKTAAVTDWSTGH